MNLDQIQKIERKLFEMDTSKLTGKNRATWFALAGMLAGMFEQSCLEQQENEHETET